MLNQALVVFADRALNGERTVVLDCLTALLMRCNTGLLFAQLKLTTSTNYLTHVHVSTHAGSVLQMHARMRHQPSGTVPVITAGNAPAQRFTLPQNVCFELVQFALLRLGDRNDG